MPAGRVWIGTAGWSYNDWIGRVYPSPQPRGFRPLEYLSRFFDCVEVNVTFYRIPDARTVAGWVRQVAHRDPFRFVCKLHQQFTHDQAAWGKAEAEAYLTALKPLRDSGRFGGLLVQLPWSARNNEVTRLRLSLIAERFAELPLVLELRHASWDCPEAREWMRGQRFHYCNIDQPPLRDCLLPSAHATGDVGYVRLHGRNREAWFAPDAGRDRRYDYCYRPEELEEWVPRIQQLLFGVQNAYVIANNHYRGQAVANALQLRARIDQKKVAVPPALVQAYPELTGISLEQPRPEPTQRGLFDGL